MHKRDGSVTFVLICNAIATLQICIVQDLSILLSNKYSWIYEIQDLQNLHPQRMVSYDMLRIVAVAVCYLQYGKSIGRTRQFPTYKYKRYNT